MQLDHIGAMGEQCIDCVDHKPGLGTLGHTARPVFTFEKGVQGHGLRFLDLFLVLL